MATAARTALREAVIAVLEVAEIVAEGHVHDTRTTAVPDAADAYPLIVVRTPGTRDLVQGRQGLSYERQTTVLVDCYSVGSSDAAVAAQVDQLSQAVTEAVLQSASFVGTYGPVLEVDEAADVVNKGARRYGLARIEFVVPRLVNYTLVGVDCLKSIVLKIDLIDETTGEPDGNIDAEVHFEDLDT